MDIIITDLAREQCLNRFNIDDETVKRVVEQRDNVEIIKIDERSKLGLYSKKSYELLSGGRAEVITLVIGHFKDEAFNVSSVFRIPKEIYVAREESPLGLLKDLVGRYGIELTIGATKAKFILKERIAIVGENPQIVTVEQPVENFITCFYIQLEPDGKHAQCVLCFALDMDAYQAK